MRRRSYIGFISAASFVFVLCMPLWTGCKGKDSNVSSSANAKGIVLDKEPYVGSDIVFSIGENPSQVKEVVWVFKEAESMAPIGDCAKLGDTQAKCSFTNVGNYIAEATVYNIDGTYKVVSQTVSIIEPVGLRDQKPIIVMEVSSGQQKAVVSTFHSEETGEAIFPAGTKVAFDFSKSHDDHDTATLKFEAAFGEGAAFAAVEKTFEKTFDTVGSQLVRLRATDSKNNVQEKAFNIYITCNKADTPELVLDSSVLNVSMGNALGENWHDFTAGSVVKSGGKGPFKYMWDFNGDGAFDTKWLDKADFTEPVYVNHAHKRQVKLKVWDTTCQYVAVATKEVDFTPQDFVNPVDHLNAGPLKTDYYWIQGKVSSKTKPTSLNTNVDSWSGDKVGAAYLPRRVQCKYDIVKKGDRESTQLEPKANFYIEGEERYKKGANDSEGHKGEFKDDGEYHGLSIKIQQIADDTFVKANGGKVDTGIYSPTYKSHQVRFYTDRAGDGVMDRSFLNKSSCEPQLKVKILGDGTPCSPIVDAKGNSHAQEGKRYAVQVWGTFTCPDMEDQNKEQLKIDDGAFFCEQLDVDACVGGCCCCCCGVPPVPR